MVANIFGLHEKSPNEKSPNEKSPNEKSPTREKSYYLQKVLTVNEKS